jgi:hypothetical protein
MIRISPPVFRGVNASFRIAAASNATISGMTPGKRAPPWVAGAKIRPAFTNSTIGAPQPTATAATPCHPRRSRASPRLKT